MWPKWRFLWPKMAILGQMVIKMGLPITLDGNDGQNKLQVCISKNMAKMGQKSSKNGLAATFGQSLDGYNSAIFHPILTNKYTKMIYSSRRIDWWKELSSISFGLDFGILSHFEPLLATWATLGRRAPNHLQKLGIGHTYHPEPVSQNSYSQKNLYHPPPLSSKYSTNC